MISPHRLLDRCSRLILSSGVFGVALIGASCSGPVATSDNSPSSHKSPTGLEVPTSPPSITGTITRLVAGDSIALPTGAAVANGSVTCSSPCVSAMKPLRNMLVEDAPRATGGGADKSVITMLAGARVLRRGAAGVEAAGFDELRVGQRVRAWFDGPVLDSYPTQAKAAVVIIER